MKTVGVFVGWPYLARAVSVQSLLYAVMQLGREVAELPVGDPRLAEMLPRVDELEDQVRREREMAGPLVADAARSPDLQEMAASNLERALESLRSAVASKRADYGEDNLPTT
jgi:hypothetical protein